MLAPLRDRIVPKNPYSSLLPCATKECYFLRLSVDVYPDKEGYEETKWIISEDANVEQVLDVLASIHQQNSFFCEALFYGFRSLLTVYKDQKVISVLLMSTQALQRSWKPVFILWSSFMGTKGDWWCWGRILKRFRTTTPPSHDACTSSHGYPSWLEITSSAGGSLLTY